MEAVQAVTGRELAPEARVEGRLIEGRLEAELCGPTL